MVLLFDENTPLTVIEALQPDILAKGADYDPLEKDAASKKYIVGSDVILKKGGTVHAIEFEDGFSTTATIHKINQ